MANAALEGVIVSRASLKNTRTTPQKSRRVVNIIRGERLDNALTITKFANQEVAGEINTLLNSAFSNAKNANPTLREPSELFVVEALVDEAPTMKRFRPRAQGRGFKILKRSSSITVVLSSDKNYRSHGPSKSVKHGKKSEGKAE